MNHSNESLHDIADRYEKILETSGEAIYGLDVEGRVTFVNNTAERLTGWPRREQLGLRQHDLVHHTRGDGSVYPRSACPILATLRDGVTQRGEEWFWRKDGSSFLAAFTSKPLFNSAGEISGAVVAFSDHTAHRLAKRYQALVEAASDFVWTCTPDGSLSDIHPNWLKLTGMMREQALGWGWLQAFTPEDRKRYRQKLRDNLASETPFVDESRLRCADGRIRWFLNRTVPVEDNNGRILEWVGAGREITRRKLREQRLKKRATLDQLTKALNRWAFEELLDDEIEKAGENKAPFSLVLFDADHFKSINDEYGHGVGDDVLRKLAETVGQFVRRTDSLARWGGEEFMVLLPDTDIDDAKWLAERLRRRVAATGFPEAGQVTISIGVAQYALGESKDAVLKRVDDALYRAKESGRNRVSCLPADAIAGA